MRAKDWLMSANPFTARSLPLGLVIALESIGKARGEAIQMFAREPW